MFGDNEMNPLNINMLLWLFLLAVATMQILPNGIFSYNWADFLLLLVQQIDSEYCFYLGLQL